MRVLNSMVIVQFVFHALNADHSIFISQIPTAPWWYFWRSGV